MSTTSIRFRTWLTAFLAVFLTTALLGACALLATGAAIFVLAVGGGVLFSRRMSRPLEDLAAAAKDIAAGNWTRQVPVSGSAEAATMAGFERAAPSG